MEKLLFIVKENLRLIVGGLVVLLALVVLMTFVALKAVDNPKTKVVVNNKTFNVFLAKTDHEKQVGLSGRSKISDNQGMLFLFDSPDFYSFWMKGMEFPIDIIYIENGKVTTVVKNAEPPSNSQNLKIYQPKEKSEMVLEVNAGTSDKYNIEKGTFVKIENL